MECPRWGWAARLRTPISSRSGPDMTVVGIYRAYLPVVDIRVRGLRTREESMATTMEATTLDVGRKLVDLLRAGKTMAALDTLFSKDVVSVEAQENPAFPREMKGLT